MRATSLLSFLLGWTPAVSASLWIAYGVKKRGPKVVKFHNWISHPGLVPPEPTGLAFLHLVSYCFYLPLGIMGPLVSSQTYRESFLHTPPPINRSAAEAFCHHHAPHRQHGPPHAHGQVPDAMDVWANPPIYSLDSCHRPHALLSLPTGDPLK